MVANTRRALSASTKLAWVSGVPFGIRMPVRLVYDAPQLAQWLSWLVAKATWKPDSSAFWHAPSYTLRPVSVSVVLTENAEVFMISHSTMAWSPSAV